HEPGRGSRACLFERAPARLRDLAGELQCTRQERALKFGTGRKRLESSLHAFRQWGPATQGVAFVDLAPGLRKESVDAVSVGLFDRRAHIVGVRTVLCERPIEKND